MQENSYNIGTRNEQGDKHSAGIAYIVIPYDVDRAVYIRDCYESSTVDIYSEHNGYHNRVPIDRFSLNFITFPKAPGEHGTPVSFKNEPTQNIPFVDGIFFNTDELSELEENQFRFKRKLNGNFIELVGSAEDKYIGLNVNADSKGEIHLKVRSKDLSGKLNIHVDGNASITSTGELELKQFKKYTCVTVNPNDNEEFSVHEQTSTEETFYSDKHNVNSKEVTTVAEKNNWREVEEFKINDGKEPFVLGKKFADFMKDLIQEIGQSTVTTALGTQPLINSAQIILYKEKVDQLLSEIGFIDK